MWNFISFDIDVIYLLIDFYTSSTNDTAHLCPVFLSGQANRTLAGYFGPFYSTYVFRKQTRSFGENVATDTGNPPQTAHIIKEGCHGERGSVFCCRQDL